MVRNDSGKPTDQVMKHLLKNGVKLEYGDLAILVEPGKLEEADTIVADIPVGDRHKIMWSVDTQLRRMLPLVRMGAASKKTMDNFYNDMLLWTALKKVCTE